MRSRSSERAGSCPCDPTTSRPSPSTPASETAWCRARRARPSSSRPRARQSSMPTSGEVPRDGPVRGVGAARHAGPVFMMSATLLPSTRSSDGIGGRGRRAGCCRDCPHTWATSRRATPTGICPPPPNCWPGRSPPREAGPRMSRVAPTMQLFFTDRLAKQRQASPATVALLSQHHVRSCCASCENRTGKQPSDLRWEDLDARRSPLSWTPSRRSVTTRPAAATPALPRSVVVPLRRPSPPRARPTHRPGARHPPETLRQAAGSFLEPAGVDALLAAPDLGAGRQA